MNEYTASSKIVINNDGIVINNDGIKIIKDGKVISTTGQLFGSPTSNIPNLTEMCPGLGHTTYGPPGTPLEEKLRTVGSHVMILNDVCNWSRKDIADWLESLDVDLSVRLP